jgi:hypothetical protein
VNLGTQEVPQGDMSAYVCISDLLISMFFLSALDTVLQQLGNIIQAKIVL